MLSQNVLTVRFALNSQRSLEAANTLEEPPGCATPNWLSLTDHKWGSFRERQKQGQGTQLSEAGAAGLQPTTEQKREHAMHWEMKE